MQMSQSKRLLKKARQRIPGATQTLSKGSSQFVEGVAPAFIKKGKGCYVWDVDGNRYIDYLMALGPVILGHNHPAVTSAVKGVLGKGTTFTLPHPLEHELARVLCDIIPCAQMARFGKNGSDATSGAVRLARAVTGREKVACCGYHGWQDWYIATTAWNRGVPECTKKLTLPFQYNDLSGLKKIFDKNKGEIACVIMEPVGMESPKNGFLRKVKRLAHGNGALLIFDEIVTGFRFTLGGAQEYFGVVPDLACFGKAMGNGFPISAVVGKRDIMKDFDKVFFSFTFGGEIVSIAAALATIREIKKQRVIPRLWRQGEQLQSGYNKLAGELGLGSLTRCVGFAPRNKIFFYDRQGREDLLVKSLFQQECIKRGLLFTGNHLVCYRHTDREIKITLRVYRQTLGIIKKALETNSVKKMIKGVPLKAVFRS